MHANSLVTPLQFRNCIFEEAFNNLPDLAAVCAAIGSSVLAQAGRALISSTQCCHQTHILYVHHESQRGCPPWQVCSLSRSVTCSSFEPEHPNLPNWQSALGVYEQQAGTDCNLSVYLQGSSALLTLSPSLHAPPLKIPYLWMWSYRTHAVVEIVHAVDIAASMHRRYIQALPTGLCSSTGLPLHPIQMHPLAKVIRDLQIRWCHLLWSSSRPGSSSKLCAPPGTSIPKTLMFLMWPP